MMYISLYVKTSNVFLCAYIYLHDKHSTKWYGVYWQYVPVYLYICRIFRSLTQDAFIEIESAMILSAFANWLRAGLV